MVTMYLLLVFLTLVTTGQATQPQNATEPPTNATSTSTEPYDESKRTPVICLKNVERIFEEQPYNRFTVLCLYDDEYISDKVAAEYPVLEQVAEPDPKDCMERVIHLKSPLGSNYYLSWLDDRKPKMSWIDARNFCRKMCMDLIALETVVENVWVKNKLQKMEINELWTSGRLCNFRGCEFARSPQVWPRNEYGWFWASSGVRIAPYNDNVNADWSYGGPLESNRQPNNAARRTTGKDEACLAIEHNTYCDGFRWHDELCELRKPFMCEESEVLLDKVKDRVQFD